MAEAKILVDAESIIELVESHDAWSGSLHPSEVNEYLSKFKPLLDRAVKALDKIEKKGKGA